MAWVESIQFSATRHGCGCRFRALVAKTSRKSYPCRKATQHPLHVPRSDFLLSSLIPEKPCPQLSTSSLRAALESLATALGAGAIPDTPLARVPQTFLSASIPPAQAPGLSPPGLRCQVERSSVGPRGAGAGAAAASAGAAAGTPRWERAQAGRSPRSAGAPRASGGPKGERKEG